MQMLPRYVLEATALETGIGIDQLKGRIKEQIVCDARRAYYNACRELGLSTTAIGHGVNRDHSTVVQVCKTRRIDPEDRLMIDRIKRSACNVMLGRRSNLVRDLGNLLEKAREVAA
jgi:hypothetical protein